MSGVALLLAAVAGFDVLLIALVIRHERGRGGRHRPEMTPPRGLALPVPPPRRWWRRR